ncbi:MAG: hypothetical protein SGPRY_013166 [Prymnesium sp.]
MRRQLNYLHPYHHTQLSSVFKNEPHLRPVPSPTRTMAATARARGLHVSPPSTVLVSVLISSTRGRGVREEGMDVLMFIFEIVSNPSMVFNR